MMRVDVFLHGGTDLLLPRARGLSSLCFSSISFTTQTHPGKKSQARLDIIVTVSRIAPVPLRTRAFQLHNYKSATLLGLILTHTMLCIEKLPAIISLY